MSTKKILAMFAMVLLLVPVGFAQNASTNTSANASTNTSIGTSMDAPSEFRLNMKQFSQGVSDAFFDLRMRLTADSESRVELIHERNEILQERQREWVEIKNNIQQSSELSVEEKRELREEIQQEHRSLIEKHVEFTTKLQELKAEAEAEGNSELKVKAEERFRESSRSGLSSGLGIDFESEGETKFELEAECEDEIDTEFEVEADDSVAKTEAKFGLNHSGYTLVNHNTEIDSETNTVTVNADLSSEDVVGAQCITQVEIEHEVSLSPGNWTVNLVVTEDGETSFEQSAEVQIEGDAETNASITREEAIAKAESYGVVVTEAELEEEDGRAFWKIEGNKNVSVGPVTVTAETEVLIDAETGTVMSVKIEGESETITEADDQNEAENESDAEFESESEVEASGQSNGNARASVRANVNVRAGI